jgi:intracellular sulfur oxidation DsrE/DsrF family protein
MKHLLAPALFAVAFPASTLAVEEGGMGGMAATAVTGAMAGAAQGSHYAKQKVVYHINYYDPKKQAGALRNIQNHINAVGADNLDVKVVLHGNGVALLLEPDGLEGSKMKEANATDEMQARISGLKDQGVAFNVCANTLKGRKVDTAYLYDYSASDVVPSGVAELTHLQSQGYTYIKP